MMLSQVTQRLDNFKDSIRRTASRAFLDLVREVVADTIANGSPGPKVEGTQTIGLHIHETMRLQLLNEQQRWGIKGYRNTVYTALRIGLELLKASDTVVSVPPASVSAGSESEAEQDAERLNRG
jgi:hypothetical protein